MKTAALLSGVTLIGWSAFSPAAETSKNSDTNAKNKRVVSPAFRAEVKEVPSTPAPVPPSAKPLPSDLITTSLSGRELEFLMTAVENGRVIEWLSETAREKAQNEQLKAVGGALAGTQAKENKVLIDLAKGKGLNLHKQEPPIQQSKIEAELRTGPGAASDKVLADHLITAARKSVSVYEQGVGVKDEEIRKMAEQMLPLAKEKLQLVSRITDGTAEPAKRPAAGQ